APATGDARAGQWAEKLWQAALAADEYAAADVVTGALDAGLDAETVLLEVIGAVQHRVGLEWAANRIGVADEHAATARGGTRGAVRLGEPGGGGEGLPGA